MFTGIVEEMGELLRISKQGETMVLSIQARVVMGDLSIGDSVAVNGVCLTVTALQESSFCVDVMPQTFRHSNLSQLHHRSKVNLERAMSVGSRFGGHIVQGHVDGIGVIKHVSQDQNAVLIELSLVDDTLTKYIIPQGSITLDGISLTVVRVDQNLCTVSIIPHTLGETILKYKGQRDSVNIECDIIGKYVDHLLGYRSANSSSQVNMNFLSEHGFV